MRKSEWVGRENHIYLHYTDWAVFCAHLQCLSIYNLLRDSKQVFLIGDEVSQYPIDFKERFGVDYSQYPVKPIGVREINRLIWHTQLSSHNGGDFSTRFLWTSNLLAYDSVMFEDTLQKIEEIKKMLKKVSPNCSGIVRELSRIRDLTDKDILVAFFLSRQMDNQTVDQNARVTPAIFSTSLS